MTPEMMGALREQVAELVQTYSNNYPQFQRPTYNETQIRVDFVNRFFKLLGWDVDNERSLPQLQLLWKRMACIEAKNLTTLLRLVRKCCIFLKQRNLQ